jgi:hypothetical protein
MSHLARVVLLPLLLLCRVPASWAQADPAQVAIGERLFLETRFSQFYFARAGGNPNATLSESRRGAAGGVPALAERGLRVGDRLKAARRP